MAIITTQVNVGKQFGKRLIGMSEAARTFHAQISELSAICANMTDGIDYTMVESVFGLGSGQGESMVAMFIGLDTAMTNNALVKQLKNQYIANV